MSLVNESVPPAPARSAIDAPQRLLSVFDGVMIIVGIIIGGGIFSFPPLVAAMTGSVEWMFGAWLFGAVLALIGALCYAELATTFPSAGGDYHFLTRAYGRDVSFFFAWARVLVITTGAIALLAFVFGDYMSRVLSLGEHSSIIYAVLIVVVLGAVNIAGLRESARTQNVLSLLLLLGMLMVVVAGFVAPHRGPRAAAVEPCRRCSARRCFLFSSPSAVGTRRPTSLPRSRAALAPSSRSLCSGCWWSR
jgi:amino acid transporter